MLSTVVLRRAVLTISCPSPGHSHVSSSNEFYWFIISMCSSLIRVNRPGNILLTSTLKTEAQKFLSKDDINLNDQRCHKSNGQNQKKVTDCSFFLIMLERLWIDPKIQ
jgi:hypothetical protein